MELAWHGSASVSLRWPGGPEVLVDPMFSPPGSYGPWYVANTAAPDWETYLSRQRPDWVFITHGHFDHTDVLTVRRLVSDTHCRFAASRSVLAALQSQAGAPPERLFDLEDPRPRLPGLTVRVWTGVHWLTGAEGDAAAAKLNARPDRFGVMPAGGPMLGVAVETPQGTVAFTGDNLPAGLPTGSFALVVANVGGRLTHPVTKEPQKAICDVADLVAACREGLRTRTLVPVHFDLPIFLDPIDLDELAAGLRRPPASAALLALPYNVWCAV